MPKAARQHADLGGCTRCIHPLSSHAHVRAAEHCPALPGTSHEGVRTKQAARVVAPILIPLANYFLSMVGRVAAKHAILRNEARQQ